MKLALKQNFVATMFTLGCFGMTMHADLVRKLDGSPTVVLVGPAGRGKTTGLLIAMACAGICVQIRLPGNKFRIGVCCERSQTLTVSKDKENEN